MWLRMLMAKKLFVTSVVAAALFASLQVPSLAVGDVILGISGKRFSYDPRTELGQALTTAESESGGGNLSLIRWRAGVRRRHKDTHYLLRFRWLCVAHVLAWSHDFLEIRIIFERTGDLRDPIGFAGPLFGFENRQFAFDLGKSGFGDLITAS